MLMRRTGQGGAHSPRRRARRGCWRGVGTASRYFEIIPVAAFGLTLAGPQPAPPIVPAVFRKLDALAVLTGPLLPAPHPGRVPPDHRPDGEKAWEKAHDIVRRVEDRVAANSGALSRRRPLKNPENTGSQRLLAIAAEGERFDRALWTRTAAVTGGAGNSNALVGTPEVVAQAILDYVDLGVDIISMRGYDLLADAVDIGRHVIPIVRDEVAKRDRAMAS